MKINRDKPVPNVQIPVFPYVILEPLPSLQMVPPDCVTLFILPPLGRFWTHHNHYISRFMKVEAHHWYVRLLIALRLDTRKDISFVSSYAYIRCPAFGLYTLTLYIVTVEL